MTRNDGTSPGLRGRPAAWAAAMAAAVGLVVLTAAGCSSSPASASSAGGVISAVGAENEYANVLGQIGGKYVRVSAILDNPNTDPHTFEASPQVAREVSTADLIVQNLPDGRGERVDDLLVMRRHAAQPRPRP